MNPKKNSNTCVCLHSMEHRNTLNSQALVETLETFNWFHFSVRYLPRGPIVKIDVTDDNTTVNGDGWYGKRRYDNKDCLKRKQSVTLYFRPVSLQSGSFYSHICLNFALEMSIY